MGSFSAPRFRGRVLAILDVHFQIWLTAELVAKFSGVRLGLRGQRSKKERTSAKYNGFLWIRKTVGHKKSISSNTDTWAIGGQHLSLIAIYGDFLCQRPHPLPHLGKSHFGISNATCNIASRHSRDRYSCERCVASNAQADARTSQAAAIMTSHRYLYVHGHAHVTSARHFHRLSQAVFFACRSQKLADELQYHNLYRLFFVSAFLYMVQFPKCQINLSSLPRRDSILARREEAG